MERPGSLGKAATGIAGLAFVVLLAVAFWPVVSGTRSFFGPDLYYEHLPIWEVTQKALRAGESPFWLEGEYCGHPPLFIQEAPLFYPVTAPLLYTGAPVHRLADLFTLFHLWLAAFAVFLLVRELTGGVAAGIFGGVAWMLSARTIQGAIWPNASAIAALVPLLILGLVWIARGRRRAGVVAAAVAGGLALCASRPQSLLALGPLVLAVVVALVASSTRPREAALDLGLAAVLALALGAPSVLPSAALLPETSRSQGLSADAADLQPLAHGRDLDMVFLPVDGRTRWPETAAYPGALVYVLAVAAIFVRPGRGDRVGRALVAGCAAGGALGLALAFGDAGPYRWIGRLPVVRGFRVPERFLLSWSLALVLLAALVLARWISRSRRPGAVAAVALAVLCVDLVPHAWRAAPTAESAVYGVEPAIVSRVRAGLRVDEAGFRNRFASFAASLNVVPFPDAERLALLREDDGLKGALGMRFGLDAAYGAGPALARIEAVMHEAPERAMALAGAAVLIVAGADRAGAPSPFVPPTLIPVAPLPRAFLAPEAIVVREDRAVSAASSPSLDPRRTAVLEEGRGLAADPAWRPEASAVRLIERRPTRLLLDAKTPSPAVLVLLDAWERGWRARVDGRDSRVLRADGAFRAVLLDAGEHRVELRYSPPGLWEGIGLGVAGLLGLVLASLRLPPGDPARLEPPRV